MIKEANVEVAPKFGYKLGSHFNSLHRAGFLQQITLLMEDDFQGKAGIPQTAS